MARGARCIGPRGLSRATNYLSVRAKVERERENIAGASRPSSHSARLLALAYMYLPRLHTHTHTGLLSIICIYFSEVSWNFTRTKFLSLDMRWFFFFYLLFLVVLRPHLAFRPIIYISYSTPLRSLSLIYNNYVRVQHLKRLPLITWTRHPTSLSCTYI